MLRDKGVCQDCFRREASNHSDTPLSRASGARRKASI